MKARTLGYIVASCAPVWILALVAILGRNFYSPYAEPEFGEETTHKILAYAIPVRYTELNRNELGTLNNTVLDAAANRWVNNYTDGYLESIDPISPEDDETRGFRNEIESSRRLIIIALSRSLEHHLDQNQFDLAAHRAAQMLIVAEIAKYNGAQSTTYGASMQRQTLARIDEFRHKLSPESLNKVNHAIKSINADPERVKQTALRLSAVTRSTATEDLAVLPSKHEFQMMFTSNPRNYTISDRVNSSGILLAESYRVAYQEEARLQSIISLYRMTASRTNSEVKSDLP